MPPSPSRPGSRPAPERWLAAADRVRVDEELAVALSSAQRKYAANPHLEPVYGRMAEFVLRGGKRVRPRLCLGAYRILADREPPRGVLVAAACLELFHAFMLVHDDLIDASLTRRGEPTLHEAIRCDHDRPDEAGKVSSDLALLAGDWLFALGLRMLARSGLDAATQVRAQRFLADMLFETGIGEGLDVLYGDCALGALSEGQIVEAYLRKTSRYSVSGPLILGAILAGSSPAVCRALGRFGDRLGLGYQIRNDLEALATDPEFACDDLDTGKRTLVLWTAYRRLDDRGRTALEAALAMPAGPERRRRLLTLLHASGAVAACRERLEVIRAQAAAVLHDSALTPGQVRDLGALAAWVGGHAPTQPAEVAVPVAV